MDQLEENTVQGNEPRQRARAHRTALVLITGALVAALAAAAGLRPPSAAASNPGTEVQALVTAKGHLTSTSNWTIAKSANPASQMVAVGSSASVTYSITTTKSASGTSTANFTGWVCVANWGEDDGEEGEATRGLAINALLSKPPSTTVLISVAVDVTAKPVLALGTYFCYPYTITVPSGAIVAGASYKVTAHVTITNYSGHVGTPFGPSPSTTASLPSTPTAVNPQVTVSDTNGKTFTFTGGGTQSYSQSFACNTADGAHTISHENTATITQTGQSASATATIHCGTPTTLGTTLSATTIGAGESASDKATISSAAAGAGGTIAYKIYSDNTCKTVFADATPSPNAVTNASAPASKAVKFSTAATYYWQAVYSGDPNTNTLGSTSSCSSEPLTVTSCTTHGARGCPWQSKDLTTYGEADWGNGGLANSTLLNNFGTVYSSTGGKFQIGLSSPAFSAVWTDPTILSSYLPANGTAAALNADYLNPTATSSGIFGGDVAALKLNVDFSDAKDLSANSGLKFGDLTICRLTSDTDQNGKTVREFLSTANFALSGAGGTDSITDLDAIASELNNSFSTGTPSTWAQAHLENGACGGWHSGDLTTWSQAAWGGSGEAASLLVNNFGTVYAQEAFFVGLQSKYILDFTNAKALNEFFPQTAPPGPLNSSLVDPRSSSSGSLGGETAALKLNIDFADAGLLAASSGLKFGDLRICNLTSDTNLNGMSVRQLLGVLNTALGGGSAADSYLDLNTVALQVNGSFYAGTPSTWAQEHLFNGSCP